MKAPRNKEDRKRQGIVYNRNIKAGILERFGAGYRFSYFPEYLSRPDAEAVSLTLPLRKEPFESERMFPYFLGLIPEGWFLDLTRRALKIDPDNVFEILLCCCKDCIGTTSIDPENEGEGER